MGKIPLVFVSTRSTWQRVDCFSGNCIAERSVGNQLAALVLRRKPGGFAVKYIPMEFIEIAVLTLTVASCYLFVSPL
jgi:hypothetical protein